jgi:hypothetical protein
MYKSELARAAGVSLRVFSRWLAAENISFAKGKYLTPAEVKFLCEKYVIILE